MPGQQNGVPRQEISPRKADAGETAMIRAVLDHVSASGDGALSGPLRCTTLLRPYQLRPLLKFTRSNGRLLIADETGLGKTVEAGCIILDEVLRNGAARVLVACPPRLRHKWRSELESRFGLRFTVVSGAEAMRDVADKERSFRHIVSLDSLEVNLDCLVPAAGPDLDLLVIDEVHNVAWGEEGARRRKACMELSGRSRKVVGISVSPDHLEDDDLFQIIEAIDPGRLPYAAFKREMRSTARLSRLAERLRGDDIPALEARGIIGEASEIAKEAAAAGPGGEDAISRELGTMAERWPSDPDVARLRVVLGRLSFLYPLMTMTRREEVGEMRRREFLDLEVKMSDGDLSSAASTPDATERGIFRELDRLFAEEFTHLHRRQLSSSMPAMAGLLDDGMARFGFCSGEGITSVESSVSGATADRCRNITDRLRGLGADSKWDVLHKAIEDLRASGAAKKIIIFTQWLPTYRYLCGRSDGEGYKLFAASGEEDEEVQISEMRRFQEHEGFCVLLATDILSEGADLRTANCIVNYDLPYDPRKIERRIGRVDRVGQADDVVHVVDLVTSGSVDEGIHRMLQAVSRTADRSVGELPALLTEGIDELDAEDSIEAVRRIGEFLGRRGIGGLEVLRSADEAFDEEIERTLEDSGNKGPVRRPMNHKTR